MVRSELSALVHERFPKLTRVDIDAAVSEILGAVGDTLSVGGRVEIRGFGSFALRYHPARMRRNPATGEPAPTPGKYAPAFKAGKELREAVDD